MRADTWDSFILLDGEVEEAVILGFLYCESRDFGLLRKLGPFGFLFGVGDG